MLVAAAGALFLALALPGAGTRGMLAEEIQPYLLRYPIVLEWSTPEPGEPHSIQPMPPYEPGAPSPPRWVASSQQPLVAYDGRERMWPIFISAHQTALGSYVGFALGGLLGDGIAGVRRSTVLLGFLIVLLTGLFALRTKPRSSPVCAAIVASSFGMISIARTGQGFELASHLGMMLALCTLAPRAPPSPLRSVLAGLTAAMAILCHGTIVLTLLPAMIALLLDKDRRPPKSLSLLLGALGVVLPLLLVLGFASVVPFRQGSAPFAEFPWAELPHRILSIPWQSVLTLAWLGDAISIWGPLARGELSLGPSLALPSLLAALPLAYGLLRWAHREAEAGERMFVAALLTSVVVGALVVDRPAGFKLALPLEPLFALAVGEQIADLFAKGIRKGIIAAALCFAARAHSATIGLALDSEMVNPMLSGMTQRAAIARMSALRLRGPEIMTTAYNHAGVIEGWTKGAIRPLHAFAVLGKGSNQDDCDLVASWRELLLRYRPRYVLVTRGNNFYASDSTNPPAIERSLRRVAGLASIELSTEGEFPTESGARGWALLKLIYPASLPSSPEEGELPRDPSCKEPTQGPSLPVLPSFEGLTVGEAIQDFTIASIQAMAKDEVRVVLQRGGDRATFEIRPDAGEHGPTPPARGGGYGVFYRKDDQGRFSSEALVAAASALAEKLEANRGN